MGLVVTLTGDADKYLIRGAIWDLGASSYRAYVHLVPSAPRLDHFRSVVSVVSVNGPTLEKVLDAAIARVMTTIGTPVQNVQVRAAPRNSEALRAQPNGPHAATAALAIAPDRFPSSVPPRVCGR
jgi:hypothetical protein